MTSKPNLGLITSKKYSTDECEIKGYSRIRVQLSGHICFAMFLLVCFTVLKYEPRHTFALNLLCLCTM